MEKIENSTPELIRKSRKKEIMDEIVKDWESQNGPMYRLPTFNEVNYKRHLGEEIEGNETRMTDKATEFYFDVFDAGENSVVTQAERELLKRYPEYQEKPEVIESVESESVSEKNEQDDNEVKAVRIGAAQSMEELLDVIYQVGGVQGKLEYFDPGKIEMIIEMIKNKEAGITVEYLTRGAGLRQKVIEILSKENNENIENDKPTESIQPVESIEEVDDKRELQNFVAEEEMKEELDDEEKQKKIKNDVVSQLLRERGYDGDLDFKYTINVLIGGNKDGLGSIPTPRSFDSYNDLLDYIKNNNQNKFVTEKTSGHEFIKIDTKFGDSVEKWINDNPEKSGDIFGDVEYVNAKIWLGDDTWTGEHYGKYYVEHPERDENFYSFINTDVQKLDKDLVKDGEAYRKEFSNTGVVKRFFTGVARKVGEIFDINSLASVGKKAEYRYRNTLGRKIDLITSLKIRDIKNGRISYEEKQRYDKVSYEEVEPTLRMIMNAKRNSRLISKEEADDFEMKMLDIKKDLPNIDLTWSLLIQRGLVDGMDENLIREKIKKEIEVDMEKIGQGI